ncbi:chorion class CB protein M5H4-like [Manduca sexta]|uniref:chorion class CB protein M5H4-like n=1 Tax=Manduca sexta TaxID=7130 RepID=UPI00188FB490|nr:chorion class CB protein M5H4-like [Manduca sexta]
MMAKSIFVLCTSAFVMKCAFGQCLARETLTGSGLTGPFGPGRAYDGLSPFEGLGYSGAWAGLGSMGPGLAGLAPANGLAASYGGGLTITSASPIAPNGLSVTSENAIEGTLAVAGQLPFLGAVATDGAFASVGAGAVSYGCGDGAVGITAEGPIGQASGVAPAPGLGYGPALAGYNGLPGRMGAGRCGGIY